MLGAQANNSSDWPATLPKVWPAIEYLHANTLEIPIYWEQFEPRQGQFDYSQIDSVLAQARAHNVHLVLLWFGTWKNGSQHYMPEWMKLDPEKYAHVVNKNGERVDSPSPLARPSLDADIRAFTAFMRHLKAADPERTVLMVQVENETGTWGTLRDYSAEANKLFTAAVPDDVLKAMNKTDAKGEGWAEVFGPDADVYFHAWAIARYVGQIALAGKAVYPLPLYVNAALRNPFKGEPGSRAVLSSVGAERGKHLHYQPFVACHGDQCEPAMTQQPIAKFTQGRIGFDLCIRSRSDDALLL
jgi:beta-galactosidase GanA